MQYRILGALDVVDGRGAGLDLGGRKQRAVLAALLLEANRPVSVDRLVEAVWGDAVPAKVESSLQAYVSNLRKLLEPERARGEAPAVLVTRPSGYELVVDRADVDALRVEDLVAGAHELRRHGDLAGAATQLRDALDQWAPLLPDFAGEHFTLDAAARLETLHGVALEAWFEARLQLGDDRELIPGLEAAVAAHPLRERLHGQLALARYRAGRQTDALRALADARRTLAEEVGVDPGPELRRLEALVLAQAPELDLRPVVPPSRPQPAGPAGREPTGDAFVGRRDELAALLGVLDTAVAGTGRIAVISGEAGIGKTRLVQQVVAEAGRHGMAVAWARCPESAAQAAFWTCLQLGTQLLEAQAVDRALLEPLLPYGQGTAVPEPTADRLALDNHALRALASASRPLLLVIDDLQWADPASLRMIEFSAGALRSMPVALVVTVRPTTPDTPADVVACLGELARQPSTVRVELGGLGSDDVADWLQLRAEHEVPAAMVDFVHERTAGNPFFLRELVELLAGDGRLGDVVAARAAGVPAAVQDVLRRRVGRLPAGTQQLLPRAAVVGRTFDADVLADVAGTGVIDVLDALDPAIAAGLVDEDPAVPGRYRFSHALVAETLAEELSPARRARAHAAVTTAMERLRAADLENHLPELAHHALAGALAGTAERAFDYATRAAERASQQLAFEDAAEHLGRALRALELARPGDARARYDTLHAQGLAHLRADAVLPATRTLLDAARVAEGLGDVEAMARAVAALNLPSLWPASDYRTPPPEDLALLERLAGAVAGPPVLRADILCALATGCAYLGDVDRLDALTAEALDLARASGDPTAVVRAAVRRYSVLWTPDRLVEREALSAEMVQAAADGGLGPRWSFLGHFTALLNRYEAGDVGPGDPAVAQVRQLAERSNEPAHLTQWGFFEASYQQFLGNFDEAVAIGGRAGDLYRRTRAVSADAIDLVYGVMRAIERGQLDEMLATAQGNFDTSYGSMWVELLLWALVEDGRLDEAREVLPMVPLEPDPPKDFLWAEALTAAAHTRALLGETAVATRLAARLEPFAGLLVVGGSGGVTFGAVAQTLAVVAHAAGDDDAAAAHVAHALAIHERLGAVPWIARSLVLQARILGERDPAASAAAARRARALVQDAGLVVVARQLDAIGVPA